MDIVQKVKVTEIQPGDVVDFEAHKGLDLIWDQEQPIDFKDRPQGLGLVTAVEHAETTDNGRRRSYIKLTFAERTLTLFKGSKLPVV